jgi:subtilase family serine protease
VVHRRFSRVLPALTVPPLIMVSLAFSTLPAQASGRQALAGGAASWSAHSPSLGHASRSAGLDVKVYLAPRGGQSALSAAVAAVSTPGSPSFRQFMSVSQYNATYEPTAAQVARTSAWLRANGLRVTGVESAHRYVSASGSVAAVESAFATTINEYRHNGQQVLAPATAATIPAALATDVLGVSGLDTTVAHASPDLTPPPPAFNNGRPCSIAYGQILAKYQADYTTPLPKFDGAYRDYAVCGYAPDQFRAAYEGSTTLTGAGATVAIIDAYAAATINGDANKYSSINGDSAFAPNQFTQVLPTGFSHQSLCGPGGWAGEETLDVEAVHAMAPDANVRYYAGRSCLNRDLIATLAQVVDDNKASIVTNSYGDLESNTPSSDIVAYDQILNQAAMQGISVLFSSGDNGDEVANTGLRQADYPASDTLVTAVGGTSTAIGQGGALDFQTGWGTEKYSLASNGGSWVPIAANPFLYGSGGGYSALFNRPSYQDRVVPSGQAGRAVPDISMDADPTTGMLVGETQRYPDGSARFSEFRLGGTSLSSPLFAGITALATQHDGSRIGFLNPSIYKLAVKHSIAITDVLTLHGANVRADYANGVDSTDGTIYSVRTFDQDSSLKTTPGWDDVTGVGAPNPHFVNAL